MVMSPRFRIAAGMISPKASAMIARYSPRTLSVVAPMRTPQLAETAAVMPLMLLRGAFAKESLRAEDQDQDQNREADGVGPPGGDELVAPGGEKADRESAEGRSRHVADASQDGGGERPQARLVAHPP